MSEMENDHRKRMRKMHMQELVLKSVAAVGIIGVALIAPQVLGAIKKMGLVPKSRQREYVWRARNELLKQGMLRKRANSVELTTQGEKLLQKLTTRHSKTLPQPKKWDKKWRVLIFDIPETKKASREKIRIQLSSAGFVRAQDSVWIFPYPCEEFVALLKVECRVGFELLYMIVDSLEGDERFRNIFNLPLTRNTRKKPVQLRGISGALLDTLLPPR